MSEFTDRHILVTGGAGFIGSHIVERMMREGAFVRVLDDMSNGTRANINQWIGESRFELVVGDMRNLEITKQALEDISLVFHQAAKVSVPVSVKNPQLVMDVNVMGTTVLLDECRRQDATKVVVASSSSVYGDTPTLPKVENMMPMPISPYAVSKLAEEHLAMAFCSTYGLDATALRYFNVYGPRQRGGAYAGVISRFISQAIQGAPLTIDGDGQQTRDFTYIDDVVECNILSARSKKSTGNVYNVGSGKRISIEDLADVIMSQVGCASKKVFAPPRLGDVHDSLAGVDKAKADIGYLPKIEIREGITKTIAWVRGETRPRNL